MKKPEDKKCPSCSGDLPRPVTRKRACPCCGMTIHLAVNPDDERKYAVTEEEQKAFWKRGRELYQQREIRFSLAEAERARGRGDEARQLFHLGEAVRERGWLNEAAEHLRGSADLARSEGRWSLLAAVRLEQGRVHRESEEFERALPNYLEAYMLATCTPADFNTPRGKKEEVTPLTMDLAMELGHVLQSLDLDGRWLAGDGLGHLVRFAKVHDIKRPIEEILKNLTRKVRDMDRERLGTDVAVARGGGKPDFPGENWARRLLGDGESKWWELRDTALLLLSEEKTDLAWTCFRGALEVARKIGRSCETIYDPMGRQALKEGRPWEGLRYLLQSACGYAARPKRKNPMARRPSLAPVRIEPSVIPNGLRRELDRAAKVAGVAPKELPRLVDLVMTKGEGAALERFEALERRQSA